MQKYAFSFTYDTVIKINRYICGRNGYVGQLKTDILRERGESPRQYPLL